MIRLEKKYQISGTVGDQVTSASGTGGEKVDIIVIFHCVPGLADPAGLGDGGVVLPAALRVQQTDGQDVQHGLLEGTVHHLPPL